MPRHGPLSHLRTFGRVHRSLPWFYILVQAELSKFPNARTTSAAQRKKKTVSRHCETGKITLDLLKQFAMIAVPNSRPTPSTQTVHVGLDHKATVRSESQIDVRGPL